MHFKNKSVINPGVGRE